jgi:cystathionine gamma-synthase
MKLETLAVHAGLSPDPETGAVAPPIHLSTTYARHEDLTLFSKHAYVRESNPTQDLLEEALAALEGGEDALVFASGMAAGMSLLEALGPGSRVLMPADAYYGFRLAARDILPAWGITTRLVPMDDLAELERALLDEKPALVFLETPSNPLLAVTDLSAAITMAKAAGEDVRASSSGRRRSVGSRA